MDLFLKPHTNSVLDIDKKEVVDELEKKENILFDEKNIKYILEDEESKCTSCLLSASYLIGDEILNENLEKEAIDLYLTRKLNIKIPERNLVKIMGGLLVIKDDSVFNFSNMFILGVNSVINGLETTIPEDIGNVDEITKFLYECKFLYPPYELSLEIKKYIDHILKFEGFIKPPQTLQKICDSYNFLWGEEKKFLKNFGNVEFELVSLAKKEQDRKAKSIDENVEGWVEEIVDELKMLGLKKKDFDEILKEK